jgi:FkbM family methyltransferase
MAFVSYAQNSEDVMLWRALKHLNTGFYIDIGARDPVNDSVSLAFYEHQWRGVHVEQTEKYSSKLRLARPDEVIEQITIGSGTETLELYEFSDIGLSTSDSDIAKKHLDSGYKAILHVVPVMSLDDLLEKYCDRAVNWMKIDVEGIEKNVIKSWVKSPIRPWILVIRSTLPLSQEQSYENWEDMILAKGYRFVYFDGLNRFYVHEAHAELVVSFNCPPNVFDQFVLGRLVSRSGYQFLQSRVSQAEAIRLSVEAELGTVHASPSWRLTQPLRWLIFQIHLARQLGFTIHLRTFVKTALGLSFRKISLFLSARPVLRWKLVGLIKTIGIYNGARKVFNHLSRNVITKRAKAPLSEQHLTVRGRDLYLRLKNSAKQRSEDQ